MVTELTFLKWLEGIRTPFLNGFFELATLLGEETIMIFMVAIIYFIFNKQFACKLLFVNMISLGFNSTLKNIVMRPRPFSGGHLTCIRPETATGYSFPSGHTQNIATWSSLFAVHYKKWYLWLISIIFTVLIAFSRLYLGVHYPSDVIAGALLGFFFSFVFSRIFDRFQNKNTLYGISALVFLPLGIFFMLQNDLMYEDFFKIYGMLIGLYFATKFEEKYVGMDNAAPLWKRVVRVILGVVIALLLNKFTEMMFHSSIVSLMFLVGLLRYFMLMFICLGLCPLLFKKLNI